MTFTPSPHLVVSANADLGDPLLHASTNPPGPPIGMRDSVTTTPQQPQQQPVPPPPARSHLAESPILLPVEGRSHLVQPAPQSLLDLQTHLRRLEDQLQQQAWMLQAHELQIAWWRRSWWQRLLAWARFR